ncbi:hypothetical protein D3C85_1835510 [compost metagenome]
MQQRCAALHRRIAEGLRDAPGAVVADDAQGHVQAEVIVEGQGVTGQGGQCQRGEGQC